MEDPCKPGNPREVTKEDFINLYRKAMWFIIKMGEYRGARLFFACKI
jgi:hypothetical protein